ncbi:MAG TPA: S41 family peptidase [Pyrinomonadaceae bacterium]|jgi:C-terminal processing protease CtpA/Prc|nr:S41 family peptidase [Pyrinomonadaceae bacterium]
MRVSLRIPLLLLISFILVLCLPLGNSSAQKAGRLEIGQWRDVLKNLKAALKDNYYDPNLRGIDIDARFEVAHNQMKSATSLSQLTGIAAQVLLDLDDSHTVLIPPYSFSRVDYGWLMKVVGSDCYVVSIKPGSDAEAKGLQVGDRVLSIDGRPMDRTKGWLADYLYNTLQPQPSMKLLVEKPDKRQVELVIQTKLRKATKFNFKIEWLQPMIYAPPVYPHDDDRFHELSKEVLVWKMPAFRGRILMRANRNLKNRKALILDLRGNRGGYVEDLERFTGYFFDSNIKISEAIGRKKFKPSFAESQKDKAFKGQLVILIDGESRSEAELFARTIQLQKRGVVIGDRSAGSVMRSRFYPMHHGGYDEMLYGVFVTEADVIMPDGNSLEHVGVTPDEMLLPTAEELSANLDPVLARAAAIVGIKLDARKAGELFPYVWKSR